MSAGRLSMLGSLIIATALSFELSWQAAQDFDPGAGGVSLGGSALASPPRETILPQPPEPEPKPDWGLEFDADAEPPPTPMRRLRRPRVVAAPVQESGLLEPADAVRIALRSKRGEFERCYDQELKKQAAFDGFVLVSLDVARDGSVLGASVAEGSRRDAHVGACIVATLRRLKLPALTEDAELQIPIRLQSHELAARE